MSEVQMYYEAMRKHFPSAPEWQNLHPQEVQMIIQSINLLLQVVRR